MALWFFTKDPEDSLNPSHSFEVENLWGGGEGGRVKLCINFNLNPNDSVILKSMGVLPP